MCFFCFLFFCRGKNGIDEYSKFTLLYGGGSYVGIIARGGGRVKDEEKRAKKRVMEGRARNGSLK